jgi:peptidoglycan/xylan/chitin deacetylase (PgdA/CDA1 family)
MVGAALFVGGARSLAKGLDREWILPGEPHAVKTAAVAQDSFKFCALTFDDGPEGTYTPRILDTLKREGVRATFFLVGYRVRPFRSVVLRIKADGHELANHSYSHPYMDKIGLAAAVSQLKRTQDVIFEVAGVTPIFFRPPYGEFNLTIVKAASSLGLRTVLWSVDPADWATPGEQRIRRRVLHQLTNGAVILLHVTHSQTADILPQLIEDLKAEGFHFVTVSEWYRLASGKQTPTAYLAALGRRGESEEQAAKREAAAWERTTDEDRAKALKQTLSESGKSFHVFTNVAPGGSQRSRVLDDLYNYLTGLRRVTPKREASVPPAPEAPALPAPMDAGLPIAVNPFPPQPSFGDLNDYMPTAPRNYSAGVYPRPRVYALISSARLAEFSMVQALFALTGGRLIQGVLVSASTPSERAAADVLANADVPHAVITPDDRANVAAAKVIPVNRGAFAAYLDALGAKPERIYFSLDGASEADIESLARDFSRLGAIAGRAPYDPGDDVRAAWHLPNDMGVARFSPGRSTILAMYARGGPRTLTVTPAMAHLRLVEPDRLPAQAGERPSTIPTRALAVREKIDLTDEPVFLVYAW